MKRKKRKFVKTIISNIVLPIVFTLLTLVITHYMNLREIDYEYSTQMRDAKVSEEELLEIAQKNFLIENYIETLNIYNKEKMKTNAIAISNTAFMYENGIVFKKNIQKARELYKRAAQLGERTAKENWILFNISFPRSYIELIEILKQGYEDKSKIVSEFVESYFPKNSNHTLKEFFMLEQSQQEKILKMQQYELECSEEVAKNIGKEFVSSKKIKSKKINVEVGENVVEYTFNELGNYLSRKKVISEVKSYYLTYYQKVFYFSAKNKTSYITI